MTQSRKVAASDGSSEDQQVITLPLRQACPHVPVR
eukprot:CAMPEP_0197894290 /NCGR_PEP_ID=MMETSP1439-20131203/34983_1 /TAXON_ID=66791 /ORGANISM="Gonyaulax spinifera, Strain CCMP409" /LENGTH=34 /DNA_ID= /DNA_START= /DNA_END= /DNA_ORIENTATION=